MASGDAQAAYETFDALAQAVKRRWRKLDGAAAPSLAAAGGGPIGDAAARSSDAANPSCRDWLGQHPSISNYMAVASAKNPKMLGAASD